MKIDYALILSGLKVFQSAIFSVVFYICMHNASLMFLNFLPDVMSIYGQHDETNQLKDMLQVVT